MTVWLLALLAVEPAQGFAQVKRIHVDQLNGGAPAAHMRDLLIASLQKTGLFVVTEDPERADAYLRGSADEDVYTEVHSSSESVQGRVNVGRGSTRTGRDTGGVSVGEQESSRSQERRRDAVATVRIVLKNGDVVWSTTQESSGAKFRGASADVAEKVVKQLKLDWDRLLKVPKP